MDRRDGGTNIGGMEGYRSGGMKGRGDGGMDDAQWGFLRFSLNLFKKGLYPLDNFHPVNQPFLTNLCLKNVSLTKRPHIPFVQNLVALRSTVCPLGIDSG